MGSHPQDATPTAQRIGLLNIASQLGNVDTLRYGLLMKELKSFVVCETSNKGFHWAESIANLCQTLGLLGSEQLVYNILKLLLWKSQKVLLRCIEANSQLKYMKLKRALSQLMMAIHLAHNCGEESPDETYLDLMASVLAVYIDAEVGAAEISHENPSKVLSRILSSLYILLRNSQEHIVTSVLKAKKLNRENRRLSVGVLKKVCRSIQVKEMSADTYLRCVMVFKLWKKMTTDKYEKLEAKNLALKKLKQPHKVWKKCKTIFENAEPELKICKKENVTLQLVKKKWNVRAVFQLLETRARQTEEISAETEDSPDARDLFFVDRTADLPISPGEVRVDEAERDEAKDLVDKALASLPNFDLKLKPRMEEWKTEQQEWSTKLERKLRRVLNKPGLSNGLNGKPESSETFNETVCVESGSDKTDDREVEQKDARSSSEGRLRPVGDRSEESPSALVGRVRDGNELLDRKKQVLNTSDQDVELRFSETLLDEISVENECTKSDTDEVKSGSAAEEGEGELRSAWSNDKESPPPSITNHQAKKEPSNSRDETEENDGDGSEAEEVVTISDDTGSDEEVDEELMLEILGQMADRQVNRSQLQEQKERDKMNDNRSSADLEKQMENEEISCLDTVSSVKDGSSVENNVAAQCEDSGEKVERKKERASASPQKNAILRSPISETRTIADLNSGDVDVGSDEEGFPVRKIASSEGGSRGLGKNESEKQIEEESPRKKGPDLQKSTPKASPVVAVENTPDDNTECIVVSSLTSSESKVLSRSSVSPTKRELKSSPEKEKNITAVTGKSSTTKTPTRTSCQNEQSVEGAENVQQNVESAETEEESVTPVMSAVKGIEEITLHDETPSPKSSTAGLNSDTELMPSPRMLRTSLSASCTKQRPSDAGSEQHLSAASKSEMSTTPSKSTRTSTASSESPKADSGEKNDKSIATFNVEVMSDLRSLRRRILESVNSVDSLVSSNSENLEHRCSPRLKSAQTHTPREVENIATPAKKLIKNVNTEEQPSTSSQPSKSRRTPTASSESPKAETSDKSVATFNVEVASALRSPRRRILESVNSEGSPVRRNSDNFEHRCSLRLKSAQTRTPREIEHVATPAKKLRLKINRDGRPSTSSQPTSNLEDVFQSPKTKRTKDNSKAEEASREVENIATPAKRLRKKINADEQPSTSSQPTSNSEDVSQSPKTKRTKDNSKAEEEEASKEVENIATPAKKLRKKINTDEQPSTSSQPTRNLEDVSQSRNTKRTKSNRNAEEKEGEKTSVSQVQSEDTPQRSLGGKRSLRRQTSYEPPVTRSALKTCKI